MRPRVLRVSIKSIKLENGESVKKPIASVTFIVPENLNFDQYLKKYQILSDYINEHIDDWEKHGIQTVMHKIVEKADELGFTLATEGEIIVWRGLDEYRRDLFGHY